MKWRALLVMVLLPMMSWAQDRDPFMAFSTVKGLSGDVMCSPGNGSLSPTRLVSFNPSWTYVPGFSHIGTWVEATVEVENGSTQDATNLYLLLGTGNYVAGPFTVKAGQDLFVSGHAADGYTGPTTSADYSPIIDNEGSVPVTVKSSLNGASVVEFVHPY